MKQLVTIRRAACVGAAVVASSIAIPVSSASAASGTYVSTSDTTLLGLSIPVLSTTTTTLPVAVPGLPDLNVTGSESLGGLSLFNLNIDPHMVK